MANRQITVEIVGDAARFAKATDDAVAVLAAHRRRSSSIGDGWLFPSDESPGIRDLALRSGNGGSRLRS